MSASQFYTFRVYVKRGVNVVHFEDADLTTVDAVVTRLRAQYPDCTVVQKTMQNG